MNQYYQLGSHQLKDRSQNGPIVHEMNELVYQGRHHDGFQIFYPCEDIMDMLVKFISASRNVN